MTRRSGAWAALCLLGFSTPAFAEEPASALQSIVPQAGFFAGLGGSYNSVKIDQDIGGTATSDIYAGSILVASGEAGGPSVDFDDSDEAWAPDAQAGYFSRFKGGPWLWGAKFSYKYLEADVTSGPDNIPQSGSFTTSAAPVLGLPPITTDFTGDVVIRSSQTTVKQQLALMPFIGRAFHNSYVYFGAGPALFDTQSRVNSAIGFADIDGETLNVTGAAESFSSSEWVWRGAAQIGMNYLLGPPWFVDVNYTFAMSASFDEDYVAPFSNTSSAGLTTEGVAHLDTSQRVTSQAVTVSINKVF